MDQPHRDASPQLRTGPEVRLPTGRLDRRTFTYSVVIPVYNSEDLVGTTVEKVIEVLAGEALSYEVILVNDGSRDGSWDVIADLAQRHPHVRRLEPAAQLRPAPRQPRRSAGVEG